MWIRDDKRNTESKTTGKQPQLQRELKKEHANHGAGRHAWIDRTQIYIYIYNIDNYIYIPNKHRQNMD